jgi:hypothetical protein
MNEQNVVAWMIGGGDRQASDRGRLRSIGRRIVALADRRRPQAPNPQARPQTSPVGCC